LVSFYDIFGFFTCPWEKLVERFQQNTETIN
jgi:hypothetical protein